MTYWCSVSNRNFKALFLATIDLLGKRFEVLTASKKSTMNAVMVKYNKPHHIALYDKTSKVEHNCRANCSRSYTVQGGILLWAAVPISKGEHISISYMHCSFSTMKRRDHLAGTKFLECDCDRCKDPTEFGTMFSVFTCMENDCTGFMIPPTFLAPSDNLPNFVCNKCSISVPWVVIEEMEERLDEKIDELEHDVHAMKQFVESQSKIVHKNHFAHFNSDLELIRSIDPNSLARFSEESLHDVIQRCQRLDNILETLDPAEHGQRARVCYMLVRAKAVIHERGKFCFNDVCAYVNDMDLALTKVYQLTRFEPPLCETEFEIAIAALAQLKKMEKTKPIYTN